jgi:hypothetical protein
LTLTEFTMKQEQGSGATTGGPYEPVLHAAFGIILVDPADDEPANRGEIAAAPLALVLSAGSWAGRIQECVDGRDEK